jgi:hypothetical protein
MGVQLTFRPLEGWPGELTPDHERRPKPFKTGLDRTLGLLRFELGHLGATLAVVQTAHAERDISVTTGRPRPDRPPRHPGVIVAADTRHGAAKWVCDDCERWSDNIHAITLTLERLRLADLYGVTKRGEQYRGFKMLPGPITSAAAGMSIEQAARFVAELLSAQSDAIVMMNPYGSAADLVRSKKEWEKARRAAAKLLHPDRSHGDAQAARWAKFQEACQLLDGLHNR